MKAPFELRRLKAEVDEAARRVATLRDDARHLEYELEDMLLTDAVALFERTSASLRKREEAYGKPV